MYTLGTAALPAGVSRSTIQRAIRKGRVSAPLGVPWFRAEDYARCRELMDDKGKLPLAFETWEQDAVRQFTELQAFGCVLEKVEIDPDEFVAFCRVEGLQRDSMARKAFAAAVLARLLQT